MTDSILTKINQALAISETILTNVENQDWESIATLIDQRDQLLQQCSVGGILKLPEDITAEEKQSIEASLQKLKAINQKTQVLAKEQHSDNQQALSKVRKGNKVTQSYNANR